MDDVVVAARVRARFFVDVEDGVVDGGDVVRGEVEVFGCKVVYDGI